MNCLRVVAITLIALALNACSVAPRVDTDFNPDFNFSGAHRFAVIEPRSGGSSAMPSNDLLNNRIRGLIETSLRERGHEITPPESADLLVSFFVTTEDRTEIHSYNSGFAYTRCWRCGPMIAPSTIDVQQYQEGTLMIDFIDPASKQLQWRGMMSKRLSRNQSSEQRRKIVAEVVAEILATFPPSAAP